MASSSVLDKIQMKYHTLSSKEKKIAKYILENKDTILNINIKDLAWKTNTSISTITRFCKKIECNGFVEFKILLNSEIEKTSKGATCFDRVERYYIQVISATTELLDQALIYKCVYIIKEARKIRLYGLGSSGLTATEFKFRLQRMGLNADAVVDPHMMLMSTALLNEDDLVIGISNSGMTEEVVNAVKEAKKKNVQVISITNHDHTPLTESSDVVLFTSSVKRMNRDQFINDQLSILYVLDVISMLLLEDEKLRTNRNKTLDALAEYHKI